MLVFEEHARLLLVAHAVVGAALVAVSTHLAVWAWRLRKRPRYRRSAPWFAAVAAILYVLQLFLGNFLYPTYKIRVRAEYLDNPQAIARDVASRQTARAQIDKLAGVPGAGARDPAALTAAKDEAISEARRAARIFDIKEHLVGLALPLALACPALLWAAARAANRRIFENTALAFALLVAAVTWFAALVGLVVTSIRSV